MTETFVGSYPLKPRGYKKSTANVSRISGLDAMRWEKRVKTYQTVKMGEVWPGIYAELIMKGQEVEKLFHIEPGASVENIKIGLSGAKSWKLAYDGRLIFDTGNGDIALSAPIAWQGSKAEGNFIEVAYTFKDGVYGFTLGEHDSNQVITIDPIIQSTYLGGRQNDSLRAMTIMPNGNVLIVGDTTSPDFPGTSGGTQPVPGENGIYDAFIAILSADLTQLLQATYLGGIYETRGFALAVAPNGEVLVAGETNGGFPGTTGGAQESLAGNLDMFIARLSADLTTLIQATYLGGSYFDRATSLGVLPNGDVVVAGVTGGEFPGEGDFPGTEDGAQPISGGQDDIVVARLSADLTSLLQSTYLGGAFWEYPSSLEILQSGEVLVGGVSDSYDFPTTEGAVQTALNVDGGGRSRDLVVARLSEDLKKLRAATYLGGANGESFSDMAIGQSGDVFVIGGSTSTDFPGTEGGAQPVSRTRDGGDDWVVARLSTDLNSLYQSTYLGGSRGETSSAIDVLPNGDVVIGGHTQSDDFPGTSGTMLGTSDMLIAQLTNDLRTVRKARFIGGSGPESLDALAVNSVGEIYAAGFTGSTDFPETEGGAQPEYSENPYQVQADMVVALLSLISDTSYATLNVLVSGTGSGTLSSIPIGIDCGSDCSEDYAPGTEVTLTATPAAGSRWIGWSDASCGTATTCTFTLNSAKTVTATFSDSSAGGDCTEEARTLTETITSGAHEYQSQTAITIAGTVQVGQAGELTLMAPQISFESGFRVATGGRLHATASAVQCELNDAALRAAETSTRTRSLTEGRSGNPAAAQLTLGAESLPVWLQARLDQLGVDLEGITTSLLSDGEDWLILETTQALQTSDQNDTSDLYRLDLLSDQLQLISATEQGQAGNGHSRYPAADATGERIVFHSEADDIVPFDTNQVSDIFLRDVALGQTTKLTHTEQASANPALDASGETLVYDQTSDEAQRQVFGQALTSGSIVERLSLHIDTGGIRIDAHHPAISAEGRFIGYLEHRAVGDAANPDCQVHLYDRETEVYHRQVCPDPLTRAGETVRPSFSPEADVLYWHLPGQAEPVMLTNPLSEARAVAP